MPSETIPIIYQKTTGLRIRINSLNTNEYGNFGMSTILIKTAFSGGTGIVNKNFQKFRDNRLIIAERVAQKNLDGTILYDQDGFPEGYNKNHQRYDSVFGRLFWDKPK